MYLFTFNRQQISCLCVLATVASATFFTPRVHAQTLTLDQALSLTVETHPQLGVFTFRERELAGARQNAGQIPALQLSADIENFAGSDAYSNFEQAEMTLSLSSVIELGQQRSARVGVVDARLDALAIQREATSLSVLADVSARFVTLLAAEERLKLKENAVQLANDTLSAVQQRVSAGRVSDIELLRAQSDLAQYQLDLRLASLDQHAARASLELLLGADLNPIEVVGDLFAFGSIVPFDTLMAQIDSSPAIRQFTATQLVLQSEMASLKQAATPKIEWRVGLRQFEESNDQALVAGLSLPLFSQSRSAGKVSEVQAKFDSQSQQRDAAALTLKSSLLDAYSQRERSIQTASTLSGQVIPNLQLVLSQTQAGYERGRYSYLQWVAARSQLLQSQERMIDAASRALLLGIQIEQLTGEPLLAL